MKIAYTYGGINNVVGGVARYFYVMLSGINKSGKDSVFVISKYKKNIYFDSIFGDKKRFFPSISFKGKNKLEKLLQNIYLKNHLKKERYDVIHHTGDDPSIYKWATNTPVVITIHDMIPELLNDNSERLRNRHENIRLATKIICISKNTRDDLIKYYPNIDKAKLAVIYHGVSEFPQMFENNNYGNYVLFVGARDSYKNFDFFLKSISEFLIREKLFLICTGGMFSKKENKMIQDLNLQHQVLNVGFISDSELRSLYHFAKCLVYPSLYEGFGLPILEAFASGCPVCLSNTSCFPEIAGEAGLYFNPTDTNSIEQAIDSLIKNEPLRNMLIEKGYDRLAD